jgi:hypothetical protein
MKRTTIPLALLIATLIIGCGGSGAAQTTPTPEVSPSVAPSSETAGIGWFHDWADMKMTLLEAKVSSSDLFTPDPGNQYVSVLIEVESKQDGTSYNTFYFQLANVAGYACTSGLWANAKPDLGSSNNLSAGRKATGWVSFQCPTTDSEFYLTLNDFTHDAEWKFSLTQ